MRIHLLTLLALSMLCLATDLPAATLIDDDFTTIDTASTWTITNTAGAFPAASAFPDLLRLYVSSANTSQRSFITSQASNINPFTNALTVSMNGLSSYNNAPINSGISMFYAMVGKTNSDTIANYYASPGTTNFTSEGALTLTIQRAAGNAYALQVFDYGAATGTSSLFSLSAMPTDVAWSIDGATQTWSVTLTGATFSDLSSSKSGSFTNYTNDAISRLTLGTINYGGANGDYSGAGYYLDSLNVTSVPEPSVAFLIGLGLPALFVLRRWNHRRQNG